MKVLMTADTIGGVWTYALELAEALVAHDVEVVLATMGALPSREQRRDAESVDGLTLYASDYALEWMHDPWTDVAAADAWLRELAAVERVDLVHLNGYAHASPAWPVPVVVVAHSCVASWWKAVKQTALPDEWTRYVAAARAGVQAAHVVVAPTAAMLRSVHEHYGEPRASRVIANGRDARRFPALEKRPEIFAAGRLWDEAKNIAALSEVAPTVPWPVRVAGSIDGPDRRTTELRNVEILGQLDPTPMAEALGHASIYALPARYEPFGLSVLEGALAGCALVLGDIESLRETWGDAALYAAPDDRDALSEALRRLCADDAERAALAARSRERALALTPDAMGERYFALYRELVGGAAPAPSEEVVCAS